MDQREAQRLRRRNQQLEEENNLLQVKVEVLLDMVRTGTGRAARAWLWREAPPQVGPSSSPPPSARWPGTLNPKIQRQIGCSPHLQALAGGGRGQ